jgi:hypothetical protein
MEYKRSVDIISQDVDQVFELELIFLKIAKEHQGVKLVSGPLLGREVEAT